MSEQKIIAITGFEPRRDGEYPMEYRIGDTHMLGGHSRKISKIVPRQDQYETTWYDIYTNGTRMASFSQHAIAHIAYEI
jgi:hypothetical protein